MPDFESVASGRRQRARWRGQAGWVRAERLTEHVIRLRGPLADLYRAWKAHRSAWRCIRTRPGEPPLHIVSASGQHELLLERRE